MLTVIRFHEGRLDGIARQRDAVGLEEPVLPVQAG
jgi:hypothetical protein